MYRSFQKGRPSPWKDVTFFHVFSFNFNASFSIDVYPWIIVRVDSNEILTNTERTISASITHSSADLVGLFRRLSRMMGLTCAQDEVTALMHLTLMRNSSGSNWPPFVNPTPSTGPPYVASILLLFLRTARALPYGNWLNEENNKTETNEVNLIDTNNYKKKFEGCQRTVKLLLHC